MTASLYKSRTIPRFSPEVPAANRLVNACLQQMYGGFFAVPQSKHRH